MKKKTFVTGVLVGCGLFILTAATACSSDSSSGSGGGFSCGAVGDKNCPNDTAQTQATVDACNKCTAQAQAIYNCTGGRPKCDANGKSTASDLSNCKNNELQNYLTCVQGGGGSDAGGGG